MIKINKGELMFGCATLAQPEYLEALLGAVPEHFEAILSGYEICIQNYEHIPQPVRKVLDNSWPPGEFKTYFARKSHDPKAKIEGKALVLDHTSMEVLDDWEFEGLWYNKTPVKIVADGKEHDAVMYNIENAIGEAAPGKCEPYLVDKEKFLSLARKNNLTARRARGEK